MKKKLSDSTKIAFIRWWIAGAIYFFIAFGTPLGSQISAFGLVLFLGLVLGFVTIFVFNPIIYRMFDVVRRGKIVNSVYATRSFGKRVIFSLLVILKCLGLVILVAYTYQGLNSLIVLVRNLPEGTVVLKGEPILFATFYTVYYQGMNILEDTLVAMFEKEKRHE